MDYEQIKQAAFLDELSKLAAMFPGNVGEALSSPGVPENLMNLRPNPANVAKQPEFDPAGDMPDSNSMY